MSLTLDRRGFLKGAASAGLGAAAQALGLAAWERAALAATCNPSASSGGVWGDLVGNITGGSGTAWNSTTPGYNILEIYMYGGSSPWETFWLSGISPLGTFNGETLGDFSEHGMNSPDLGLSGLDWRSNAANDLCGGTGYPSSSRVYKTFATQAAGEQIYWGAPAKPLWSRQDILDRCRMVTQFHDLAPHEAAIPFCLTGLKLGNSRMAATGAAFGHRAQALAPVSSGWGNSPPLPVSYVLHKGAPMAQTIAAATGEHPGSARPVVIRVHDNDEFYKSLARPGIPQSQQQNIITQSDDLFLALRHEYRDRLLYQGAGNPVRSAGFDGYWAAAELLVNNTTDLQTLFGGSLLVIDNKVAICPTYPTLSPAPIPGTHTMIKAAASLLSSRLLPPVPRYVCVIDSGVVRDYDTHGDALQPFGHVLATSANHYDTLKHLADNIYHSTANPTGLIELDKTMVVITTEFGRTDAVNPGTGRDHNPWGYVTVFIGGPMPSGPTIGGAIDSGGNTVAGFQYSPTDVRGAMLLAAGIDPFAAPGNFRHSDFSGDLLKQTTNQCDDEIRNKLKELILGL
jgi:Protein of unknown function (DUF1501)